MSRLLAVLLMLPWASAAAQGVHLESAANVDSVTVGERFHVLHRATFSDSLELIPPPGFDTGNCRVIDVTTRRQGPGRAQIDVELMTVDLEAARIPGIPLAFVTPAGDTLSATTDAVEVPVRHLAAAASEPLPLKPQWTAPRSLAWIGWLAAALLVAAAAVYFFLRRRGRRQDETVSAPPELPPDFVALRELSHIETLGLLKESEFKKYYTLVVDVLRRYFEGRYGVAAMDLTTYEILEELRARRLEIDGLSALLDEADLVKFAKFRPDEPVAARALESARDIVVRTAPKPIILEGEPAAAAAE